MKINDDNLVQQLMIKNEKALDYLVERYGNLLLKVAYSVLNDREVSMVCMNAALLKIWNNIDQFKGEQNKFTTWIIVIVKRIAIDELRKTNKENNNVSLEEVIVDDDFDIEEQLENKELRNKILNEVNNMEKVTKEIFLRRFFMDESVKNISKKLGISVSAVSNRILRGKKKLKTVLREEVI